MQPLKVFAIAPYPGMAAIMTKLAKERSDIELTVKIGNIRTCIELLRQQSESKYDVIISRGGTARQLRAVATVPVVEITVSVYDVLRCLKSAQAHTGKFAVVGYSNITECAVQLSAMMGYDITVCPITDNSDIKRELLRLRDMGVDLILCDRISMINAEELGINAIMLTSDEASISAAFDEAVHITALYGDCSRQNAILRGLVSSLEFHSAVFNQKGELLFSSMGGDPQYHGLLSWLVPLLPQLLSGAASETECEWQNTLLLLSASWITCLGQRCLFLKIKPSSLASGGSCGVYLTNHFDQVLSEVASAGSAAYMGEIASSITSCFPCTSPVLILGETGTGKDTIAAILYRNGPFHERMLVTVDCEAVTDKRWKMLLNQENSPFMRTGITIYLRSVHSLSNAQAEELFNFIDQTRLAQRNRLLFSYSLEHDPGEERYICTYIKNHFSTVSLRLPPLRHRRKDIPSMVTLYVNQLNAELGRQVIGFEPQAMVLLQDFSWSSNLAQLNRIVRTLVLAADTPYISCQQVKQVLRQELPSQPAGLPQGFGAVSLQQTLSDITCDIVRLVLDEENNNQSRAALRLGISRSTVWSILRRGK